MIDNDMPGRDDPGKAREIGAIRTYATVGAAAVDAATAARTAAQPTAFTPTTPERAWWLEAGRQQDALRQELAISPFRTDYEPPYDGEPIYSGSNPDTEQFLSRVRDQKHG